MNPDIERWRRKHPRCRYCVFYYVRNAPIPQGGTIQSCEAKDRYFTYDISMRGMFCKLFEPKEI